MNKATFHIHFIGICGTAMASAAIMAKSLGYKISGSDENVYEPMSTLLADADIEIMHGYQESNLSLKPNLVVVGNAISRGNCELEALLNLHLSYCSLPQFIARYFISGNQSVVITGTHGKTTTTTLLSWVLEVANKKPSFLIGGKPNVFESSGRIAQGELFVIEGDEYDAAYFDKRSKFLSYLPDVVLINNIEFDHSDIFNSLDDIILSFQRLVNLIPSRGFLAVNNDDNNCIAVAQGAYCDVETFALENKANWTACNSKVNLETMSFDIYYQDKLWCEVETQLFGRYNIYNTLGAAALANRLEVSPEEFQGALMSFKNTAKRLEYLGCKKGRDVYFDFAHHPTAIASVLDSLKERFADRRIVCAFEPRSNTSVRNIFQSELEAALARADLVFIAKLHRKEKIPINERLDLEALLENLNGAETGGTATAANSKAFQSDDFDFLLKMIEKETQKGDVIVFMSNGSFDNIPYKFAD